MPRRNVPLVAGEDAAAYKNRGVSYKAQGDLERAMADYEQAIALNPQDVSAHDNKAFVYALQGDVEGVLGALRRALELDRERILPVVLEDEDFDLVREDARFRALLKEFSAIGDPDAE